MVGNGKGSKPGICVVIGDVVAALAPLEVPLLDAVSLVFSPPKTGVAAVVAVASLPFPEELDGVFVAFACVPSPIPPPHALMEAANAPEMIR